MYEIQATSYFSAYSGFYSFDTKQDALEKFDEMLEFLLMQKQEFSIVLVDADNNVILDASDMTYDY